MPGGHTHLDRQRRTRGECPGCDADWDAQDARLAAGATATATIRQLERMAERPPVTTGRFCTARESDRGPHVRNLHLCGKLADHAGPHHCPLCEADW